MSVLAHDLCLRLDLINSLNDELKLIFTSPAVTPPGAGGLLMGGTFLLLLFPWVQG
jgi:hypothetical protein